MSRLTHKIICGDCIEIMKEMESDSVDLVVTSPPYPGNNKMWGDMFNENNIKKAHGFLSYVWDECIRLLKPGCKLIINVANTKRRPYIPNTHYIYSSIENKIEPLGEIIWNKGYGQVGTAWGSFRIPSDPALADQHEYIMIFRKYGERHKPKRYKKIPTLAFKSWRNSIWNIAPAKASEVNHIAPFPIEIPKRLIILYSFERETVLDPFLGSGTTMVAAERLGRNSIGIEISKEYCEIAYKRLLNEVRQTKLDREPSIIERIGF